MTSRDQRHDTTRDDLECRLDALAAEDAATMPEGIEQRVLLRTPSALPAKPNRVDQPLRLPNWLTMPWLVGGLAAAAAVALVGLPALVSMTSPPPNDYVVVTATDSLQAEAELFEVVTASLSLDVTADFRDLADQAATFDVSIEPDTTWLEEVDSI